MQGWIQTVYNYSGKEYLVVWEDYRRDGWDADIYGQFVRVDGTLRGGNFRITTNDSSQYWPHMDYDPFLDRYLIVFEDYRNGWTNGDIRGIFIGSNGKKIAAPGSDPNDSTFAICSNSGNIYSCAVSFNYDAKKYLVVWGDTRNNPYSWIGEDVFGQLVAQDGTLLAPPAQPDPAVNFPIANSAEREESVPDVTYHHVTGEWFVVCGTDDGYVLGYRVNNQGQLVFPNGNVMSKPGDFGTGMQLSQQFNSGADDLQAKVQANYENDGTTPAVGDLIEYEVVWMGMLLPRVDNDIYGQRIGFFWNGAKFVAKYVSFAGDTSSTQLANHEISIQDNWPDPPELAFSAYDNEFLTTWGDYRDNDGDLYGQRLWCNYINDNSMLRLNDTRDGSVSETENIEFVGGNNSDGGIIGMAHDFHRNDFLIAYSDYNISWDIYGIFVHGTTPAGVDGDAEAQLPEKFMLEQNYPNPFNPRTTLRFGLPQSASVSVKVLDILGREVNKLLDEKLAAGFHQVDWDGTDMDGRAVSSGLYFYQVEQNGQVLTGKMTLLR